MLETIKQAVAEAVADIISLLPDLLVAGLLLLAGWLLARFLRLLVVRLVDFLNRFLVGRFQTTRLEYFYINSPIKRLIGQVFYWATVLLFISLAVRVLNLAGSAVWVDRLVVYLPSLLAGGIIIIGGVVVGGFIRKLVAHTSAAANLSQPELLAQISQLAFVVIAFILGLDQIGIDVTFLAMLFGIVLAAILGGFALAFALGAKGLVENLIACQHLRQLVKPGETITVGSLKGRVLEFTATGVLLDADAGRTVVPARELMTRSFTIQVAEVDHGID
ncbi:mechanosensitive ion channel [Pseudomaricurvus sp. HS19]|uniref:mechanosensitive ion channel family protein n=1 Tax=Pseudomaricurvus sp. HS19 TaxID=2692626 RepID=UPI001367CA53|nr:mechanosensitive ion channel [Pseudomaricurvus sp. HS19]MYM65084.1 mechanosensitive ion channel [Pseudomaricurvus sp. HS19]